MFRQMRLINMVSIHAPTKGATCPERLTITVYYGFNPRSYERSDKYALAQNLIDRVSIHAPTKGATFSTSFLALFFQVSIHAPTKGATLRNQFSFTSYLSFNPRSYERSDYPPALRRYTYNGFNPRSYERSDAFDEKQRQEKKEFQSTLLRKERLPGRKESKGG